MPKPEWNSVLGIYFLGIQWVLGIWALGVLKFYCQVLQRDIVSLDFPLTRAVEADTLVKLTDECNYDVFIQAYQNVRKYSCPRYRIWT